MRGCGSYIVFKAGQPVGRGAPGGQAAVIVNQPAKGVLHAPEGGRYLHQLAQLDGAAEKAWCSNNERKDYRSLAEEIGEPDQVFLLFNQCQIVGQDCRKANVELRALYRFALVQRDGFAVLAHAHHVMAEVCFDLLLLEIKPDLRPPYVVGEHAACSAVQHGHPDHEARNVVAAAAHGKGKCAGQRPQDADKTHQRHHGIEQAHAQRNAVGREEVDVFLDTLVGIV